MKRLQTGQAAYPSTDRRYGMALAGCPHWSRPGKRGVKLACCDELSEALRLFDLARKGKVGV